MNDPIKDMLGRSEVAAKKFDNGFKFSNSVKTCI